MTSEIRANTLKNRVGLGTVSFTNTGPVVSGIVTISNSTTEGVTLEDNAGVGNSLKITTPTGYVSIGSGNSTFVHLNTDRGIFYFQKRITVDEGIISSYDENLILQSPMNTNRIIINKDTGLVSILNDLDVDGHTNLDNVSIAGVTTHSGQINMLDNAMIRLGTATASRTSIFYDSSGSNTWIKNFNDTLKIGYRSVEIYYVNQKRLEFINGSNTFSTDASTTFLGDNYHASWSPGSNRFQLNDNAKLAFGSQADTNISHNNSHLYIQNTTGNIDVTGNVELNNDLDVDGHTNLDNVSIAGVTTFSGNTTFGANGSITSAANFHLSSNQLRVTGGSTVVGEFKGTSIPTVQVTQTTNNTDLQLRANSEGGLVRTATNYPLILGANQKEKLRIAEGSYALIGINTSTFDTAGSQLKIEGRGAGTTSPPYLQIKGVGNSGLHAYVDLIATSDNNAGSSYRGLGVIMYDEPTDVEWFAGRPYAGSDKFIIGRKASPSYRTQSSEVANQFFRITSNGNVSIHSGAYDGGGTTPQLYVRGTGGRQVKIHNSNAGTSSLQITNGTTGQGEDAGTQLFTQGGTGDFFIYNAYATGDIGFGTKPSGGSTTERLRIDSDGKLTATQTISSSVETFLKLGDSQGSFKFEMSDGSGGSDFISHVKKRFVSKNTYGLTITSRSTLGGSYTAAGPASIKFYYPSAGGGNQAGGQLEFWTNENGYAGTSEAKRMQISRSGNIGAPDGNNIYNASDERLKENMVELTDGLDKIKKLKPISFNWKDGWDECISGKKEYGFGAQTTQVVDEMLVVPFGTGDTLLNGEVIKDPLRVNEKYIIPLLVKAMQEQQEQIETLKTEIATLKGS